MLIAQSSFSQSSCGYENFERRTINTIEYCGTASVSYLAGLPRIPVVCMPSTYAEFNLPALESELRDRCRQRFPDAFEINYHFDNVRFEFRLPSIPGPGPGPEPEPDPAAEEALNAERARLEMEAATAREHARVQEDRAGQISSDTDVAVMNVWATNAESRGTLGNLQDPSFYQTEEALAAVEDIADDSFLTQVLSVFNNIQFTIRIEGLSFPGNVPTSFGCGNASTPSMVLCIQAGPPCSNNGLPGSSGGNCPTPSSAANNPLGGLFGEGGGGGFDVCFGDGCDSPFNFEHGTEFVFDADYAARVLNVRRRRDDDIIVVDRETRPEVLGELELRSVLGSICGSGVDPIGPDPDNIPPCENTITQVEIAQILVFQNDFCNGDVPIDPDVTSADLCPAINNVLSRINRDVLDVFDLFSRDDLLVLIGFPLPIVGEEIPVEPPPPTPELPANLRNSPATVANDSTNAQDEPSTPDSPDTADTMADPILSFSGELVYSDTDLVIPGRGFPFAMTRTYRSQYGYDGPQGFGWDFDYNQRLMVTASGNVVHYDGRGRANVYRANGDGTFTSPQDYFDELRITAAGFQIRQPDGFTRIFSLSDGRLLRQFDRNDNTMTFLYNAQGQLAIVNDTLGRDIDFSYDSNGRLQRITDFTGRQIVYNYDANGDLTSIRSPVVAGTPTGNDFPAGKLTRYTYSSGFAAQELNHNLLTATDRGGRVHLVNTYNEDTSSYEFDRIIEQQYGEADQLWSFSYLSLGAPTPQQPNLATNRTVILDANGNLSHREHNSRGQLLTETVFTNRGVNANDPDSFVTSHQYNVDGRRIRTVWPEGNSVDFTYDSANADRYQQGNLLAITASPVASRGGDQAQHRIEFSYEPIYNQMLTKVEERGTDGGFDPQNGGANSRARYTTRHTFDYQQSNNLAALAQELGRSQSDVLSLLSAVGMSLNQGQVLDNDTSRAAGNIVLRTEPSVRLADGTSQAIVYQFEYNRFGQLTATTDPAGHGVDIEYFSEADPDGDGTNSDRSNAPGPADNSTGGYKREVIQDGVGLERPERTTTAAPADIRTVYAYDEIGHVTGITDGRGNTSTFDYNSLDQLIQTTAKAPFNYLTQFFYDGENNLARMEMQNVDTNGPDLDGFVTSTFSYDARDSLLQKTVEVSTLEILTTTYEYDRNQNLVRVTQPQGNSIFRVFDERDLAYQVTRGEGSPEESTHTFTYDGNGNLIAAVDAADNTGDGSGDTWQRRYDGFDRLIETIDPIGNRMEYRYDPAGNLVRESHFGPNNGASPTDASGLNNVLLDQMIMAYDELGRVFEKNQALFANLSSVGPDGASSPGDGLVSWLYDYDASSRLVQSIDDNLNTTRYSYDGVDRVISVTDALNNTLVLDYDKNSNLVRQTETDRSPEGLVGDEVFVTEYQFDSLDRLTESLDNLNNRTQFDYDSRGNVVEQRDALGNITQLIYDGINRALEQRQQLRTGGVGSGSIVGNASNPDGVVSRSWDWDGNSRLVAEIDDKSNVTAYGYDALNRRELTVFADGTVHRLDYDGDDNIIGETDANGSVFLHSYDGANRRTASDVARAAGVLGTTQWRFESDGLGRRTRIADNNVPGNASDDSVIELRYDSLGRILQEIQNGQTVANRFDGVGNRLDLNYATARQVDYGYDPLDRIRAITDGAAIADYRYLGRQRVLQREYGNGTRLRRFNDVGQQTGFDPLRRLLQQRHELDNGTLIAGFEYAYDKVGNRRYERDLRTNTADLYAYDSAYRLTQTLFEVAGARTNGIENNNTTNADIEQQGIDNFSAYEFDGVGNRTERTSAGVNLPDSVTYNSNEMNEYDLINGAAQSYDDNGNLTASEADPVTGSPARNYDYDALNRLVRVRESGTTIATYAYDGLGRRISKTVAGETTRYVYDGDRVIEEQSDDGTMERQFVYGIGIDDVLQMRANGTNYFYHKDALGSVVALSDVDGNVIERYNYDDYGVPTILAADGVTELSESAVGNPYLYTGRRLDPETGFYYYRARFYEPDRGRFLQRDPMGYVDGMGLYAYVNNNPINWVDPLGLEAETSGGFVNGVFKVLEALEIEAAVNVKNGIRERLEAVGIEHFQKGNKVRHVFYGVLSAATEALFPTSALDAIPGAGKVLSKVDEVADLASSVGKRSRRKNCPGCFVAGTLVLTDEGFAEIETLEIGDEVLSKDTETGEVSYKPIEALIINPESVVYELTFVDADGEIESLQVTDEHPFWVPGTGWVEALDLMSGMPLSLSDGRRGEVIELEFSRRIETTYNLTVADFHTYFVGEDGVWVHNCGESAELGDNLTREVRPRLPGEQAAHIIPTGYFSKYSEAAQNAILMAQTKFDKYIGADLRNSTFNGFWAPRGHFGTHTEHFFRELGKEFDEVIDEDSAIEALERLWVRIHNGEFIK